MMEKQFLTSAASSLSDSSQAGGGGSVSGRSSAI